ncbi:MAG: hypothetical protein H8E44_25815 [Planctomycetes bacterium]|nr:hypothetical protein [Planctomycetota bacterium]
MTDEIVREVRRVRHEISRRCGHDPRKVVAYYREFQDELKRSGNYRFRDKSPEPGEEEVEQLEEQTPVRT